MYEKTYFEWKEPPPDRRGLGSSSVRHDWFPVAEALRRNPKRWAKVTCSTKVVANNITRATHPAFGPAGTFEAVTRNGDVYARYIG